MKTRIGIMGTGSPFKLNVSILADTRGLICASSGAGKSYLLRLLAENMAEKIPTIIIDPEGEFQTLREKLDIMVIGEHGDIKPDIKSAGLLARRLVETGISAVIDINPRGKLNTRGFIAYKGKAICLTGRGRAYANRPSSPLTPKELQRHVLSVLPGPHQRILSTLLEMYPSTTTKAELSEAVGKRGGAFNNPLGRLRSMGLIDYPSAGYVVAMPFLFME